MSALRTAAQQALEALTSRDGDGWTRRFARDRAIEALEAALAEDALQKFTDVSQEIEAALAEPVQEPYDQTALELCEVCGWKTLIPGDCCLNCERKHPLGQASTDVPLTVYSVKKAEPVQEPVAWMDPNSGEVCRAHWLESHAPERDVDRFSCPLYTAPPQRKPLTAALRGEG